MTDQSPHNERQEKPTTSRQINLDHINTSPFGGKMIITPIKEDSMQGPPPELVKQQEAEKKNAERGQQAEGRDQDSEYKDIFYVVDFSEKLNLSKEDQEKAIRIYRKLTHTIIKRSRLSNRGVSDIKLLNTCSLYLATRVELVDKQDAKSENEFQIQSIGKQGVPLSQIQSVDEMRTRLSDFYKQLSYNIALLNATDSELAKDIQVVQKSLIILQNVYESMQEYMLVFFKRSHVEEVMELVWMLLLVGLEGRITDFEETFYRMYELVVAVYKNTPSDWLQPDYSQLDVSTHFKYDVPEHMLGKVAKELETMNLKFPLMDYHQQNINVLNEQYEKLYSTISEESTNTFDGRIFLKQIVLVGQTNQLNDAGVYQMNLMDYSSSSHQNILFSPLNKQRETIKGTPISTLDATLHSMHSIYEAVSDEDVKPSGRIETIFKDSNVSINVHDLDPLIENLEFPENISGHSVQTRKMLIRKLYWKTLYHILSTENNRLKTNVHTKLLENMKFRNVLFVCIVEIVFFGFNMCHAMPFSNLLKAFGVRPLDLIKAIEFVVINAKWMSSPFKRRLAYLENTCLEKLAWEDETSELWVKDDEKPSNRDYQPGFMTPVQEKRKRSYRAITNTNEDRQKPSLNFFFHKVSRLVSRRVFDLCSYFNVISDDQSQKIFNLVLHLLHEKRHLMRGRHIDHLIMCSMYVICNKLAHLEITFSDIIHHYRYICDTGRHLSQTEIDNTLYKVKIFKGDANADIVTFYNELFIQDVKTFVFEKEGNVTPPPSSPQQSSTIPQYEMDPLVSPARRRVANSVFLSPLPPSRRKQVETPRSKVLLSFEGSSIQHAGGQPLMHSPSHFYTANRKRDRPTHFRSPLNLDGDEDATYKQQMTTTPQGNVLRRRRPPQFDPQ